MGYAFHHLPKGCQLLRLYKLLLELFFYSEVSHNRYNSSPRLFLLDHRRIKVSRKCRPVIPEEQEFTLEAPFLLGLFKYPLHIMGVLSLKKEILNPFSNGVFTLHTPKSFCGLIEGQDFTV